MGFLPLLYVPNAAVYDGALCQVVVNINKYWIKFSLTNDVVGVAVAVGVGRVVIGSVVAGGGSKSATAVDVSTGAAVAADDNDAVSTVIPPSSTKDKDAYISASVVFVGSCIGAFTDSAGKSTAASALLPLCCHRCAVRRRRALPCCHRR